MKKIKWVDLFPVTPPKLCPDCGWGTIEKVERLGTGFVYGCSFCDCWYVNDIRDTEFSLIRISSKKIR